MGIKTVSISSYEVFLASVVNSPAELAEQERDRNDRLVRFPYVVMLQIAYPELDFANRWCWHHFGPSDGECTQHYSEYRVCALAEPHSHAGKWMAHWFEKIDYNFGFNEWYFVELGDRDCFPASVDQINWGEKYPK